MLLFIVRRLGSMLLVMVTVSLLVFVVLEAQPGSVATKVLGPYSSEQQREIWMEQNGYNRPLLERYVGWLGNFFTGDFGTSTRFKTEVSTVLWPRLANTGILAAFTMALVVPISLGFGVLAGMREGSRLDRGISLLSIGTTSIPEMASAPILAVIFVSWLGLLPGTSGFSQGFSDGAANAGAGARDDGGLAAQIEVKVLPHRACPRVTPATIKTQLCIQREIGGAAVVKLETLKGSRRQALAAGLALMGGLRVVVAAAQVAIPRYTFLRGWGGFGQTNGRFDGPRGVAVFANRVYVADSFNNRIQQFTRTGEFTRTWGALGSRNGQFNRPRGVAVDQDGLVYVADTLNHRVQIFSPTGQFIRTFGRQGSGNGQFSYPWGVAIGRNGRIYVSDSSNNRVQEFNRNGRFRQVWGRRGSAQGFFNFPRGIVADRQGRIYVADGANNRVQVFRANGDFLRMWGREGTANGTFQDLRDIAVDSGGRVLVTDTGNKRVQVFARGGRYLTQLTSRNIAPAGFAPMGITVDAADRLYIADTDNDRVDMFTTSLP